MIEEEIVAEEIATDAEMTTSVSEDETVSEAAPHDEAAQAPETNYADVVASDLCELKEQFPELSAIEDITEIDNPIRYAGLRDLGLTPREAYLATNGRSRRTDNRSHLSSGMPRGAGTPRGGMSREELYRAREIFDGMSDSEIQTLYRKVNA